MCSGTHGISDYARVTFTDALGLQQKAAQAALNQVCPASAYLHGFLKVERLLTHHISSRRTLMHGC